MLRVVVGCRIFSIRSQFRVQKCHVTFSWKSVQHCDKVWELEIPASHSGDHSGGKCHVTFKVRFSPSASTGSTHVRKCAECTPLYQPSHKLTSSTTITPNLLWWLSSRCQPLSYSLYLQRVFRHDFKLKQLILVVGTVKTNSWAIAVTSKSEIVENLAFTVSSLAEAKIWGEWCKNLSVARCGPYTGERWHEFFRSMALIFLILLANNKENTIANQTLFIHCIALCSDIPLGKEGWVPTRRAPSCNNFAQHWTQMTVEIYDSGSWYQICLRELRFISVNVPWPAWVDLVQRLRWY